MIGMEEEGNRREIWEKKRKLRGRRGFSRIGRGRKGG